MIEVGSTEGDYESPRRLPIIIYLLITNHYATLHELEDVYDIDEVLDMYEALIVDQHNKAEMMKQSSGGKDK